jgi:hypothetical protein
MAISSRGEMGVGGGSRGAGGITGGGGKNVNPVYSQSFPPSSVKVVPAKKNPAINKITNSLKSWELQQRKSGRMAQAEAAIASHQTGKPSKTIKINSK